MIFSNILYFSLKTIIIFKESFYSKISTVKCEDNFLKDLTTNYTILSSTAQFYLKIKTTNFLNLNIEDYVHFINNLKLESISLVNGNDSKIVKEWKETKSKEFIKLYNEELKSVIFSNLTKNGDKVQIKIKVDEKIKEFIFFEFKVSGDFVEFINCCFSTQKECYLNYFPKEVHSINYSLYNMIFFEFVNSILPEHIKVKNITEGENIKSSTIETLIPSLLFFDLKEFKKPNEIKFRDFNLSLKQSEEFKEIEKTPEKEEYDKPLTLFFETTKNIPKISFDMFFSKISTDEDQLKNEKNVVEILNDEKITKKVEPINFNLLEIQKEENSLKIILGRPAEEINNLIKAKGSLSIKFIDFTAYFKTIKVTLDAEEKIEDNFIFTTFTVKKDENNSKLYDTFTEKKGFVSITLNGKKGTIGTYWLHLLPSGDKECFYSDKLISIPFGAKLEEPEEPGFSTKKVIIVVIVLVGILILVGIFAYFYNKKKEENLDTV